VQAEILREFRRMNRDRSTSMLFISHDLGVVEALCDRVLVMQSGRVVEEVSPAQLASQQVEHPYTRQLLAATPRLTDTQEVQA
jgi:peptide/nickel transport system permease protein